MSKLPTSNEAPEEIVFDADLEEVFSSASHAKAPASEDGLERHRHRKRSGSKGKKTLKIALIVVAALVLVAGSLWGVSAFLRAQGQQAMHVDYNEGQVVTYEGQKYRLNENMVTVCLMGYDRIDRAGISAEDQPGQADVVAVMALDVEVGKATCIVIPRESMVSVDTYAGDEFTGTKTEQLCLAFTYGNGTDTSAANVVTSVQRILHNMPVNYYIAMNRAGIRPLNDAVGGVTVTALETIPNTGIVEGEEVTLLGTDVECYVISREFYGTQGTVDRMGRQTQYAKAFARQVLDQAISAGGIGVMTDLFDILQDYATTNLGMSEFSYLASVLMDKGISDLEMVTLTGSMEQGESYAEFTLDSANTYQVVLDTFFIPLEGK